MESCMDRCSTIRPLCYGVAFNHDDGTCWFKNKTFTYQSDVATQSNDTHLAVARRTELTGFATDCPYNNGTTQEINGANFTIHCNQDILGADYCPMQALNCLYHTDSFDDCMNLCTSSETKCSGIVWNPDMKKGFGNCYPKFNLTDGFVARNNENNINGIAHSAVLQYPKIRNTCESAKVVASSNGTGYTLTCNQDRAGNDLTHYHDTNLKSCIDTCEQYTVGECVGVIFDTNMQSGFENCYLKSGIGTPNPNRPGYVLALKGGTVDSGNSTDGSGDDSGNGSGSDNGGNGGSSGLSGGAIAGIVIGCVAGLALIGLAAWFFLRKRRSQSQAAGPAVPEKPDPHHSGVAYNQLSPGHASYNGAYAPAYSQDAKYAAQSPPAHQPAYEMESHGPTHEMAAQEDVRHELPGALDR